MGKKYTKKRKLSRRKSSAKLKYSRKGKSYKKYKKYKAYPGYRASKSDIRGIAGHAQKVPSIERPFAPMVRTKWKWTYGTLVHTSSSPHDSGLLGWNYTTTPALQWGTDGYSVAWNAITVSDLYNNMASQPYLNTLAAIGRYFNYVIQYGLKVKMRFTPIIALNDYFLYGFQSDDQVSWSLGNAAVSINDIAGVKKQRPMGGYIGGAAVSKPTELTCFFTLGKTNPLAKFEPANWVSQIAGVSFLPANSPAQKAPYVYMGMASEDGATMTPSADIGRMTLDVTCYVQFLDRRQIDG